MISIEKYFDTFTKIAKDYVIVAKGFKKWPKVQ